MKIEFKCINCGSVDSFPESQLKHYPNSGRFCSKKCRDLYYKTHPNDKYRKAKKIDSSGFPFGTFFIDGDSVRMRVHRKVMQDHVGRKILPTETVHHINGIKTDNRIENLIILTKSAHHKIHSNLISKDSRDRVACKAKIRWKEWKSKNWSRNYINCTSCGKTENKHQAKGLCSKCYMDKWTENK